MKQTIQQYVMDAIERGECKCGRCTDVGDKPDPQGPHTVDMIFFKAALASTHANAEEFMRLSKENEGDYVQVDPFNGKEHSYLELGGWLGDQGIALCYMALGTLLGVFDLYTPRTVLPQGISDVQVMQLAGAGLVTVKSKALIAKVL